MRGYGVYRPPVLVAPGSALDAGAFIACGIPALGVEAPFAQDAHLPNDSPENIDLNKLQVLGSLSLNAAVRAARERTT